MNIYNVALKLKIQVQACMRGIHGAYVLVERADLKYLLDDHDRVTKLMWSSVQRSIEEWKVSLSYEEFLQQLSLAAESVIQEMPGDKVKIKADTTLAEQHARDKEDFKEAQDNVARLQAYEKSFRDQDFLSYGDNERADFEAHANLPGQDEGKICDMAPKVAPPLKAPPCNHVYYDSTRCHYCKAEKDADIGGSGLGITD